MQGMVSLVVLALIPSAVLSSEPQRGLTTDKTKKSGLESRWPAADTPELARARQILLQARQAALNDPKERNQAGILWPIIVAQLKSRDFAGAEETFRQCCPLPQGKDALGMFDLYVHFVIFQTKARDLEGAQRTVDAIQDEYQKAVLIAMMGMVEADREDRQKASTLFSKSIRMAEALRDAKTRMGLLVGIATAQLRQMPKDAARTVAMIGGAEGKDEPLAELLREYEHGTEFTRDHLEVGLEIANHIADAHLRGQALLYVERAQADAKDVAGAARALRQVAEIAAALPAGASRDDLLAKIAVRQVAEGSLAAAIKTAKDIQNEADRGFASQAIAEAEARAGHSTEALRIAQSIKKAETRDYPLESIVGELAKSGDIQLALQTAGQIGSEYLKCSALGLIARGQVEPSQLVEALKKAAQFQQTESLSDAMACVASGRAEGKDLGGAFEIAKAIPIAGRRGRLLRDIAYGQIMNGDLKNAEQTLELITDQEGAKTLRSYLAVAQAKAGDIDKALQTWGKPKNESSLAKIFEEFAEALVKGGRADAALRLAMEMKDGQDKATALRSIASGQAEKGDTDLALAWAQNLQSPFLKASALLGTAAGILKRAGFDISEAEAE